MSTARLARPQGLIELIAQAQALGNRLHLVVGVHVGLIDEQGDLIGIDAQVGEDREIADRDELLEVVFIPFETDDIGSLI